MNLFFIHLGAPSGSRTRTISDRQILSPVRLPIPPSGHIYLDVFYLNIKIIIKSVSRRIIFRGN